MAYTWRKNLDVGVPAIDQQHRRLIAKINALVAAMEDCKGLSELKSTLRYLECYVTRHFHDEERFMMQINYPDLHMHMLEHEYFRREFQKIKADIHENGASTRTLMLTERAICSWINEHIFKTDRKISVYVLEREGEERKYPPLAA